MTLTAFSINIYKYKIKNWCDKKQNLLNQFDSFESRMVDNVITSPINLKSNILAEEIKLFEQDMQTNFLVKNFWFQKYKSNMHHNIHTHGAIGYSSVCFIEYNKEEHKPTTFISPFQNSNGIHEKYEPKVEEGDIIFFPSNLLHYAPLNLSDKERIIASFNLIPKFGEKQNSFISY